MTTTGDWLAIVGPFRFPWGQAGSRRVYGVARSLAAAGFRVVVGSGEDGPALPEVLERDGQGEILHVGLGELNRSVPSRLLKATRALVAQGASSVRWLERQPTRPSHVVVYGGYAAFMARVLRWGRRRGVPVIADVVEWYDPSHVPGGRFGPFHLSTSVAMRLQYPRCSGVIAISSFLASHYRDRGVPVVCVPPTLDVAAAAVRPEVPAGAAAGPLVLLYAGSPGKKDLLVNVIRGIERAGLPEASVRLDVVGVAERELGRMLGGAPAPPWLRCLGRVPQEQVAALYLGADFSVLLREPIRYAQAGFPTKVTESLAAGVPVICNLTSDLGEHVHDGVEGIVCRDHSAEAFAAAIRRAATLAPPERASMRRAARLAAERGFDHRVYRDTLAAFLQEVRT